MVRLVVTALIAVFIGVSCGAAQYYMTYGKMDERLAKFKAGARESQPGDGSGKASTSSSSGEPMVEVVGGTTYDFGTMQQGSTKSHSFTFRNVGKAPLELKVAGSSCRCTIGTLADSSLLPGEETVVNLEWKATGVLNEFGQTATISTNDPEHAQVLLSVKGFVSRTVIIDPETIELGEVSVTGGAKRSLKVFGFGPEPFQINSATWSDERTAQRVDLKVTPIEVDTAKYPQHARATGAAQIDFEMKPGMPMGAIDARIQLATNDKAAANLDLNVTGTVVGDIQFIGGPSFLAANNLLQIGNVDRVKGSSTRMHISVQGPLRESIKLEVAEVVPADTLKVTIGEPRVQSSRLLYPLICTVPENSPPAMFPGTNSTNFGKIVIKTSHPDIPSVRISVRLIVE